MRITCVLNLTDREIGRDRKGERYEHCQPNNHIKLNTETETESYAKSWLGFQMRPTN